MLMIDMGTYPKKIDYLKSEFSVVDNIDV